MKGQLKEHFYVALELKKIDLSQSQAPSILLFYGLGTNGTFYLALLLATFV